MKILKPLMTLTMVMTAMGLQASVQLTDKYQLAVIENASGSGRIIAGQYASGIEQLTALNAQSADQQYENAMSLCAAQIKLNALTAATTACDEAVSLVEQTVQYRQEQSKYKALALNNRAIVKYLTDDNNGAYMDFNQALSLNEHRLITANFQYFATQLVAEQFAVDKP